MSKPTAAVAVLLLVTTLPWLLQADTPQRKGVLVLKNGRAVAGLIRHDGDRFVVSPSPRSELRIPDAEVEHWCDSLADAYRLKRSGIQGEGAGAHLDLAEWCLRNGMAKEAAAEVLQASLRDPRNRRIPILTRRLRAAREQKAPTDRRRGTPVRTVTHSRPRTDFAAPPPGVSVRPASASSRTAAGPSPQDLTALVRGLKPADVQTFTHRIQPMLVNSCGAAGCHGPSAGRPYQLLRPRSSFRFPHRYTQRNLHATLAQIDRRRLEASPLLKAAFEPHGGRSEPVLGRRNLQQVEQLVTWVRQVVARQPTGTSVAAPSPRRSAFERLVPFRLAPSADRGTAGPVNPAGPPTGSYSVSGQSMTSNGAGRNPRGDFQRFPAGGPSQARPKPGPISPPFGGSQQGGSYPAARRRAVDRNAPSGDPFDPAEFNKRVAPSR